MICRLLGHKFSRKGYAPGAWSPFGGGKITMDLNYCDRCYAPRPNHRKKKRNG